MPETTTKKVLFIAQEIVPYVRETELSSLSRYLPERILAGGHDVRVFMPKYGTINERRNQLHEVKRLSGLNIVVDDDDHPLIVKVATSESKLQVYFIDNEEFYNRKSMFTPDPKTNVNDNAERAVFFVKSVLETVKRLRWIPDVIQCTGWFTALVPLYLKTVFKDDHTWSKSKIVYTLHREETEGSMGADLPKRLYYDGITPEQLAPLQEGTDTMALRRLGMAYADGIAIGTPVISDAMKEALDLYKDTPTLHCYDFRLNEAEEYRAFYRKLLQMQE